MTHYERYRRAFSTVHTSTDYYKGVKQMNTALKFYFPKAVAACLAVVFALGAASVAYAADVGGIQRTVQVWLEGDRTDAVLDIHEDGSYNLSWQDEDGTVREQGGGGVAIEEDGKERPLTEDEIMEHLNEPDVSYKDDGTVWVYYYNQALDITDKFDNGVCYVKLIHEEDELYLTVKYGDGYSFSPNRYISPDKWAS
ncbi:hypothetical protein SDC9_80951 [bioreactor metagenome]|uniref:Uncharacterized protein n=1 Tax=bioreactor metagenome TaxID=1076179 RepID=A0A644Z1D4_9ZZZZ